MGAVPSPSQRKAIEADPQSLLVLAGPGAGKTFCLTERIRYLIEEHKFDPSRICAFTFTNKAAGEIAHRLESRLGEAAGHIKRGTIHAFCADLLREHGSHVGLDQGFGIADEEYQLSVLRRIEGPRRWHRSVLNRFSAYRFRGDPLRDDDQILFLKYEKYLSERNVVDFDTLVIKAAELLENADVAPKIRSRWDVVLVDEFQDLNPVQYRVVRALAKDHKHVFAVGDDEQSIYSWAGADPKVFTEFVNDFGLVSKIHLEENRRCPHDVFALARTLITINTPIFADRVAPRADRVSEYPVRAIAFDTDDDEAAWVVNDVRKDRETHQHHWGDVALLYRKHEIGDRLEAAFLNAGIPCRLPQGRALSDDPIVAYVIAATRVIAHPEDDTFRDDLYRVVLPRPLFDEALAKAEEHGIDLRRQLQRMAAHLPRADENGRQVRRALADSRNLTAIGKQHATLTALVQELLSRRVGKVKSVLDDRHDEISDPASHDDVEALADRLRNARSRGTLVWIQPMGGADVAIKGMLVDIGINAVRGSAPPPDAMRIVPDDVSSVGIALGVFKAAQLLEMDATASSFTNFTAIDLETTDNDIKTAEVVEIAAVRVREGKIVDRYSSFVKPRVPIAPAAAATHGIKASDVATAPFFEDVWPEFRAFCGADVIVAHNGYDFDFRILHRMARAAGKPYDFTMFDTLPLARDLFPTSRKLVDLSRHFGIDTGKSHRALDDTLALAQVLLKLSEMKQVRARKSALVDLLGHLGVALALCDEKTLNDEAKLFRRFTRPFALGPYSNCLEFYEREHGGDISLPTVDQVINALGGVELMTRLRQTKTADQRYPAAMMRLRRLLAEIPDGSLDDQMRVFLERIVLSKWDGLEPATTRVNLLTLHSTKGLEFSRVYVVGAEDGQLPGSSPNAAPKQQEIEEARRLLYVGMTRTVDRLVLTRAGLRAGRPTGGHQFLDEMGLKPVPGE